MNERGENRRYGRRWREEDVIKREKGIRVTKKGETKEEEMIWVSEDWGERIEGKREELIKIEEGKNVKKRIEMRQSKSKRKDERRRKENERI